MKTLALLAIAALTGCMTTVTTNTLPDGTQVTVSARSADPVAIKAALDMANIIAPIVAARASEQTPVTP